MIDLSYHIGLPNNRLKHDMIVYRIISVLFCAPNMPLNDLIRKGKESYTNKITLKGIVIFFLIQKVLLFKYNKLLNKWDISMGQKNGISLNISCITQFLNFL